MTKQGMIDLATLDSSILTPLVGQSMIVRSGEHTATLEVTEVRTHAQRHPGAQRDPFTVSFRGVPGLRIAQGVYQLQHPGIGTLEIFITQTGDGVQGSEFESIFS